VRGRLLALALAAALSLVGSIALAAPPPAIPVVPDANRAQTYNITSPTYSLQVPWAIYGDCSDITLTYNGVVLINNTDFTYASASGGPTLTNLPLPITDMVITFATSPTTNLPSVPPSSGTLILAGSWHARRTTQPTAPGINRRENCQAADWAGHAVAEALGIDADEPAALQQIKTLLKILIKNRALKVVRKPNKTKGRDKPMIVVGDPV
jgi:hypothetical protein